MAVYALLSTSLSFVPTHALQARFLQSIGTTSGGFKGARTARLLSRLDHSIVISG